MGKPAYIVGNLLDASATLTPGTEDPSYPVENLYGRIPANPYRSLSLLTFSVLIDLGAAKTANTLALINHNFTSAMTATLKAGAVTPPVTTVATLTYREYDIWANLGSQSARYWLLEVTDTNSAALQLGQLVLKTRTLLPESFRRGRKPFIRGDEIFLETEAGVPWVYPRYKQDTAEYLFRVRTAADQAAMRAWYLACNGRVNPCVFIENVSESALLYGRLQSASFEPSELPEIKGAYDIPVSLRQETRGLELA